MLFSIEKHPILPKLGAFYNNLFKIHPIYVIWALSSLMKIHQSLYQISQKVPQKAGTYLYVNVRTPPPPIWEQYGEQYQFVCYIPLHDHAKH